MSKNKPPPYILLELPDLTESVNYPIKSAHRVKYTCFDVSKTLIAFGATSGGIYVFNRTPCEFLQLIPNKDGPITRLSISPDDKHIAFANGRGIVSITECDQSHYKGLLESKEHQGNEVTAMVWSGNNLFAGDDVGKISVLQMQNFITKKMFHTSSQTIMNLDSRICQLDAKDFMLLVSTLTRCYICDTSHEQYRQIGQKLREGEYGACFVNLEKSVESPSNNTTKDFSEVKQYNIVDDDIKFADHKGLENTMIYCARPSSRLWEASIDGTVKRTHQFKQVLAKQPINLISLESYSEEKVIIESNDAERDAQAVNLPKIFSLKNIIFSFKKDALYFLDVNNENDTVWYEYKDIIDCKIFHDFLYLWLSNGSLVNLRFMKIDKLLLKCYLDEKYFLCGNLCALFKDYLLSKTLSNKLHILVGLRDKLPNNGMLTTIDDVLNKFESLKSADATQMKSGIYIVDNTYNAQCLLEDDYMKHDDNKFGGLAPETLQTLKDLSHTVTDKISSSTKILKEKWEDFEGKMKYLNNEKSVIQGNEKEPIKETKINNTKSIENSIEELSAPVNVDNDIIFTKESSQKAIEVVDNNSVKRDKICKSLYQYFRLSIVGKETEKTNLTSLIDSYACDIREIYDLMLKLEQYCLSVGAKEESKFVPNHIFLNYLNLSSQKDSLLESITQDEILYKYFVDSCISVNTKTQKLSNLGCKCGYPLPYIRTNQAPMFSELIDSLIEKQWLKETRDQCYDICRKMPYLWKKIIYLRRNEDLMNLLRLLLQMLDENLLHTFLPQFTLDVWDRAIQLYAVLHANICLNCNTKFDHISVKETLSWDDVGLLMIKSVGGKNAIKIIEKHAKLIDTGELTLKFYHTCLLVALYEKYDATLTARLADAIYSSFEFDDVREEICNLLRSTSNGKIRNTALPLLVAAKTTYWGLSPLKETIAKTKEPDKEVFKVKNVNQSDIIENLPQISNNVTDCSLCGLPLQNEVLIKDGGLWVFKCGHIFHGACLDLSKLKLCPTCEFNL